MSNTRSNFEMNGILLGLALRNRKTPQEKVSIIQQTMVNRTGSGNDRLSRCPSVWYAVRPVLFKWKKQYHEGSLTAVAAGEVVVPVSELAAALKQVCELQRLLGKPAEQTDSVADGLRLRGQGAWSTLVRERAESGALHNSSE